MLLSTMTEEEIYKEIREDYWELRPLMQSLSDKFIRDNKRLMHKIHFIPPTGSKRTVVSRKNKNTYTMEWHIISYFSNTLAFIVYTSFYDRAGKMHYVLIGTPADFIPVIISSHMLQRYRERYIEPHHVKLNRESLLSYFLHHNGNSQPTNLFPKHWTEEEKKSLRVHYCEHGLIVCRWGKLDMPTLITFLDEQCLSEYKAFIYKSENISEVFHQLIDIYRHPKGAFDVIQKQALMKKLISIPNAKELLIDFFKREKKAHPDNTEAEDNIIETLTNNWDNFIKYVDSYDEVIGKHDISKKLYKCYADLLCYGEVKDLQVGNSERKELLDKIMNPEKQKFIPHDHAREFSDIMQENMKKIELERFMSNLKKQTSNDNLNHDK